MKNRFLLLFLGMLIFTSLVSAGIFPKQKINISFENPQIFSIIERDYLINPEITKQLSDIAQKNSEYREYKLHDYDCTQFSERLVYLLKKEGYRAQCTAGNNWAFDYTNHTWVSVWINDIRLEIEATSGKILNTEEYSTYEVNWEDKCW